MYTLDEMIARAVKTANQIIEKDGRLPTPAFVAQNARGDVLPILAPISDNDQEFAATLDAIRDLFQAFGARRYVTCTQAYMLEGAALRDYRGEPLADHPDAREVLSFVAVDIDGTLRAGHCYVLKPEHGNLRLSPIKMTPGEYAARGAIANLLKPANQAPAATLSFTRQFGTRH